MSFAGLTELEIDPAEVAVGRTALALNAGPIRVADPGPDWGDAQVQAQMAQLERGEAPVAFRVPNRQVRIPLLVGAEPASDFDDARVALQQKVGRLQAEGGWLKRGEGLYADVVNAVLNFPDKTGEWIGVEADVVLTLECIPDFYGDEIDLLDHVETTAPELVWTSSGIKGDYPGRLRIVVDSDQASVDQLALLASVRSRHYDPASTARMVYEAEALTPLDVATATAVTGASGSGNNAINHASLSTDWLPVMNTNLVAGTYLTHEGGYRVFARVRTTSSAVVSLRLLYDVGDMMFPVDNAAVTIPVLGSWFLVDLGEVRLDASPIGSHRWQGMIQAKADAVGANVAIDRVWFFGLDDGFSKIQAQAGSVSGLVGDVARDSFAQTAGSATGKTAEVGGVWAGAGDSDDFTIDTTGHTLQRTAVSDAALATGRYLISGATALGGVTAQVDISFSPWPPFGTTRCGLLLRYTDVNNYLIVSVEQSKSSGAGSLLHAVVRIRVGGAEIQIGSAPPVWVAEGFNTLKVSVSASGNVTVWWAGADPYSVAEPASLSTGASLGSGKVGIYDTLTGAGALTRKYDNFKATPLKSDAAIFATRSAQIGTDGCWRQDSAGGAYSPITAIGDNLRIPPSGVEDRTSEFMVKLSRGDLASFPDSGIDDLSAHSYYRPSWLFLPELPAS